MVKIQHTPFNGPIQQSNIVAPASMSTAKQPSNPPQLTGDQRISTIGPTGSIPATGALDSLSHWAIEVEKVQAISHCQVAELPNFAKTPFKIGLLVGQPTIPLDIQKGQLWLETTQGKQLIGDFSQEKLQVLSQGSELVIQNTQGQELGRGTGKLLLTEARNQVQVKDKTYRGAIEVIQNPANPATLTLINTVLLEDYLKAVVPAESPASWPAESLKAQAVAARTYAVSNWNKRAAQGFDLMPDTSDQMYSGIQAEKPSSTQAVTDTHGTILTYGNKPINALFFAASGGYTDSAQEVWGIDLPYIQPVPDFDQASPRYRWQTNLSQTQLQQALKKLGTDVGTVQQVTPLTHTPQGRVKTLAVTGTQGSVTLDANKFRFASGLNSTHWEVESPSANSPLFTFNGRGWGHGLGMSQWGARQMAADGKPFQAILQHYYTGVSLTQLPDERPTVD